MAIIVGETRSYNNLTSIVLGNHPNGVDRTRKHEKTGEKQVDPKISANPNSQKYAQGGIKIAASMRIKLLMRVTPNDFSLSI